jgi:hypothetical protein
MGHIRKMVRGGGDGGRLTQQRQSEVGSFLHSSTTHPLLRPPRQSPGTALGRDVEGFGRSGMGLGGEGWGRAGKYKVGGEMDGAKGKMAEGAEGAE